MNKISLLFLLPAWGWGVCALFFAGPDPDSVRISLAALFAVSLPMVFILCRSYIKEWCICLGLFALLLGWWQTLEPSFDKEWAPDVAEIAHGEITGNKLVLYNVRNFQYSAEDVFEERWETREYDLDAIQGLDLFLSYWASDHIAHVIMSWDFGQDKHLAISIETRKDIHQEYSAIKGFFKQFELSYVAADEKDLIGLRTNHRKERVYMYRLNVSKERTRALLESYIAEMNSLKERPKFYDALRQNCTTAIFLHTKAINPDNPPAIDWRIIVSGHLDELLYDNGMLNQEIPFAILREKSRVDELMQASGEEHYSKTLRKNLPGEQ